MIPLNFCKVIFLYFSFGFLFIFFIKIARSISRLEFILGKPEDFKYT